MDRRMVEVRGMCGEGRRWKAVQNDLDKIKSSGCVKNQDYRISSHRSIIGKVLVKGREMVHGEVSRYVDPMVAEQNEFNARVTRLLSEVVQRIEELDKKVEEIEGRLCKPRVNPDRNGMVFELPYEPYGAGDTERCIEIPWALSCYRGETRVLDVGFANAEERFLKELLALRIQQLCGIDLVKKRVDKVNSMIGDVRSLPFRKGSFDLVLCISTIEHIGKDNNIYCKGVEKEDPMGDITAAKELYRITKKGGRMVITAPYGKLRDYGWFVQYDEKKWQELIMALGFRVLREDFFKYDVGWHRCCKKALADVLYQGNGAPAAAGLVCALLEKCEH